MAEITAAMVKTLREKTDLSMMDCKKALVESGGDETQAMEILRKKFADKMTDRADKEAANGRIGFFVSEKGVALAEIRCETDFVATNDQFTAFSNMVAGTCLTTGITDPEKIKTAESGGRAIQEHLVDLFGKLRENIAIHRLFRVDGAGGAGYVHHNGKVGAVIACDKDPGAVGRDICMHIASSVTLQGLSRDDINKAMVNEAHEKAMGEVEGKPEQIKEKIVGGKMDKWYGERVLLEQAYVKDDKKTVGQVATEAGFNITGYLKHEVGAVV